MKKYLMVILILLSFSVAAEPDCTAKPYTYKANVIKVIDGDTFKAEIDLGFYVSTTQTFRLKNVDTPETFRPKTDDEQARGKLATQFVKDLILDKDVIIESHKTGKYGRWLAVVYIEGQDKPLYELIIEAGHVKQPIGGE